MRHHLGTVTVLATHYILRTGNFMGVTYELTISPDAPQLIAGKIFVGHVNGGLHKDGSPITLTLFQHTFLGFPIGQPEVLATQQEHGGVILWEGALVDFKNVIIQDRTRLLARS